jgi:D-beta-D-heptose 7-phosphate kinase/D-beta-D-heptose 1-phosphate adenosyltransferase
MESGAYRTLADLLGTVANHRIVVAGDLLLDEYLFIDCSVRMLPQETGRTTAQVRRARVSPGGAGTTACQLLALGCSTSVVGVVGDDWAGTEIVRALEERGADTSDIAVVPGSTTGVRTRPIFCRAGRPAAEGMRIDRNRVTPLPERVLRRLGSRLEALVEIADGVALADYASIWRGVVDSRLIRAISALGSRHEGLPIIVDSRTRIGGFRNVMIKANVAEATLAFGDHRKAVIFPSEAQRLLHRMHHVTRRPAILTAGDAGIYFCDSSGFFHCPSYACRGPADPTGAGSVTMATILAAISAGGSMSIAVLLGTLASGITTRKLYATGTATRSEILMAASTLPASHLVRSILH